MRREQRDSGRAGERARERREAADYGDEWGRISGVSTLRLGGFPFWVRHTKIAHTRVSLFFETAVNSDYRDQSMHFYAHLLCEMNLIRALLASYKVPKFLF